jgi:hypothetical protein
METTDGRIRASDAEREEYATILRAAMTEGRLSLEEGEERLAKVYAATYRDELGPLTYDLPDGGRRALFDTPEFREQARRHLRRHTGRVALIATVLVGFWVLTAIVAAPHFFWPAIPIAILLIGLFRRRAWHRAWLGGRSGPWGHGWAGRGSGWGERAGGWGERAGGWGERGGGWARRRPGWGPGWGQDWGPGPGGHAHGPGGHGHGPGWGGPGRGWGGHGPQAPREPQGAGPGSGQGGGGGDKRD